MWLFLRYILINKKQLFSVKNIKAETKELDVGYFFGNLLPIGLLPFAYMF